jgi:hypothetical protein
MEAMALLELEYFRLRYGYGSGEACVDWASDRLQHDQEGDDLEIVLLAGARKRDEILDLVTVIINRYCGENRLDDEFSAGKYVAALHADYLQGRETVESVDVALSILYQKLGYPDWLVMLARNCEYATDIPEFKEPFESEFAYVASLWDSVENKVEFDIKYSREISNQHDVKYRY